MTIRMRHAAMALAALIATTGIHGASAQALAPEELFDAAIGDFNRDGRPDLAVLAQSDTDNGDTSLYIYFREDAEDGVLTLQFSAEGMLWGSGGSRRFYGQEPSLKALDNGSLAITEQNWAVGRERWSSTATIAWRGERFIVAGYTYNSFDTLQEDEPLNCDLNLLTGRGVVNDRAISFPASTIALSDWTSENGENPGLRICRDPQ